MKRARPKKDVKPDSSVLFLSFLDPRWVSFSQRRVSFEQKSIKNGGEVGLAILCEGACSWMCKLNQMQVTD